MNKKILLTALTLGCSALFSASALAGDLNGMQVSAALSSSSSENVSNSAQDKTITIGFGYSTPITNDGSVVLGGQIDSTIHFGSNSNQTINLGASLQPGYYVNDNVLIYGKIGTFEETKVNTKLHGSTLGVGIKYKVSQNTYVGGEIEHVKFNALKETRISAKVGYLFD